MDMKEFESKMKNYEETINDSKKAINDAEKKLIVEKTHKDQYESRLRELEKECNDTFGVSIDQLAAKIEENQIRMEEINNSIRNVPLDLNTVTEQQVDKMDELF